MKIKRYCSNYLITVDKQFLKQQIVELMDGTVINYYPLIHEVESVEWLPGVIELNSVNQTITAHLLFPYDFILRKPVGETQRIQLM